MLYKFLECYYYDPHRDMLWVIPQRCASTTFRLTLQGDGAPPKALKRMEALDKNLAGTPLCVVIRHPYDRAVSAIYSILSVDNPRLKGCTDDTARLTYYLGWQDHHVRPQAPAVFQFRVDHWIRVDRINEDWKIFRDKVLDRGKPFPETLPHAHQSNGKRPQGWRGVCDWERFYPLYADDFKLCPEWERA